MKTAGIILILFSGTGLGLCKSMELTARLKILEKLAQLLLLLKEYFLIHIFQSHRLNLLLAGLAPWKMPFLMLQQKCQESTGFFSKKLQDGFSSGLELPLMRFSGSAR